MANYYELLEYERKRREEEERKRKAAEEAAQARRLAQDSSDKNKINTAGKSYAQIEYERQRLAEYERQREAALAASASRNGASASSDEEKNKGGFFGGLGFLGRSFLGGTIRGIEGLWDYTAGGLASIFGGDAGRRWAERQMTSNWYDYDAAAREYNPGGGWKLAGDVVGGVGQSVFSIGVGLGVGLAMGGAGLAAAGIGAGVAGISAAGTAVSEAAQDPNADRQGLDYTDWLYGTGSGIVEGGLELVSGGVGDDILKGVGKGTAKALGKSGVDMGSELLESITKKTVKNTVKNSVGREIIGEMAEEGLQEGISAFVEPYIKQATYDADAENATAGDIFYSAMIGALAGGATIGGVKGVEGGISLKRGSDIAASEKKTADLLHNAGVISGYEKEKGTGSEVFAAVAEQYEKVQASLAKTGGKAQTAAQKMMLGELDRYVASAALQPSIVSAARGVAMNAESYAESLNKFYAKTNAGRTVSAEELTAGLNMSGNASDFVRSVTSAMKSNSTLREVVINNAFGQMEMDAIAYADSIYDGTSISAIATRENINRFVEGADEETLNGVGRALGVDMRTVTPEALAEALVNFRESGKAREYEGAWRDVVAAKGLESADNPSTASGPPPFTQGRLKQSAALPSDVSSIQEGATRYNVGGNNVAVIKRGESYRIYDYASGKVTRALTQSELSGAIKRMRGEPAVEVIGKLVESADNPSTAGGPPPFTQGRLVQSAELDALALERIPEYKGLVETEREAVRETVRRALDNGVSEEDAVLFGRIAAKSGMNVVVTTSAEGNPSTVSGPPPFAQGRLEQNAELDDAWFDGRNTVYVNADADRSRTFSGLLGHEMWHKMFKAKKAKRIMMQAYNRLDKDERTEVEKLYREDCERLGLDEKVIKNIGREEVAAAYAEEIFNTSDVWEFVLSEEPSLKDRVLSFFRGANKKYSFEPGMTKAAKKWLSEYKKLFNEVSAYNKGRSAAENVGASEGVRKIERIGRIVESNAIEPNTNKNGSYSNETGVSNNVRTTADNKRAVSDSGVRYALSYKDAIKKLDEGKLNPEENTHLSVLKNTPQVYIDYAGAKEREIIIARDVAYLALKREGEQPGNYHNLGIEVMEKLPEAIKDPLYIVKQKNGRIAAVTQIVIKQKKPVIVSIELEAYQTTIQDSEKKAGIYNLIVTSMDAQPNYLKNTVFGGDIVYNKNKEDPAHFILRLKSLKKALPTYDHAESSAISIPDSAGKSNSFDENSSKNVDDGSRAALKREKKEDFFANGEEFSTPTIHTVGKERVTYKADFKDWLFTKKTSAYIHSVDEMYGVQIYLEKVGKMKNAKYMIQSVRSSPHQVQSMVGSVQYNVFEADSRKVRKLGEGLNEILKPVEAQGEKVYVGFNDYLLHKLNMDKYEAFDKMKLSQESDLDNLRRVQSEIESLSEQKERFSEELFGLGKSARDIARKNKLKEFIERNEELINQLRADEEKLLVNTAAYAEEELSRVNEDKAKTLREIRGLEKEIFELGNDSVDMTKKRSLREELSKKKKQVEALDKRITKLTEIMSVYSYALKPVFYVEGYVPTREQSEQYVSNYERNHPEFLEIAKKLWSFNDNLNKMRVSAGLISESVRRRMSTMYPHYVPAFRAKVEGGAKGDKGVQVSSTVKKAKGYNHGIMDVKESISAQVSQVVRNGNVNVLANKVYDTAVKTGDAKYVDIGLPDPEGADISPEGADRPKPHIVTFYRNGAEYQMSVSDEIYLGFKGIGEASASPSNVIARAFNWITDKFKKLVTQWSPAFTIRNAMRDLQDAGINTKHFWRFGYTLPIAWYKIIQNSEEWQMYRAYGGFSSTVFDSKGTKGDVGKRGFEAIGLATRLAKKEKLSIRDVKYLAGLAKGVSNLNAVVEQVPRFAEFLASLEAGETIEQAIYNSAEVTTNFARRGATTKAFNSTIVPFLNPAIQGFDKIFRNFGDAFEEKNAKAIFKGLVTLFTKALALGILPMLLNSLMYEDDEDYKDLREEDKENNYLFKLPNGTFLKLPRGRVASVIAGLANRTKQSIKGEDPDWLGYAGNVVSQITPVSNLTRTIFSPFMDVWRNITWYGTAIEGPEFDNVRPKDRYDENTSSIAIALGKLLNYSPKKIHYLIDQYSGVIGDFILPLTTQKEEKGFFSGNFTLDSVTSNKIPDKFYSLYDEAQYAKTDGDLTAQYQVRFLNRVKNAVGELYAEISAIQQSELPGVEKLKQVRLLRILINEAMKSAINDYDKITDSIKETAKLGYDDTNQSQASERYAEIIRRVYGAERAIKEYNSAVYENLSLYASAGIDYEKLYTYYFTTKGLTSDKDEDGKTISGSLKKKVIDAVWQLDIPDVQKILLIASKYKLSDGDIPGVSGYTATAALYSYIESLEGLTEEERLDLFEASGFEIKEGEAVMPSASSSGGKKIVKIGRISGGTMKGSMKGSMIGSMKGEDYSKKIVKLGKIVN